MFLSGILQAECQPSIRGLSVGDSLPKFIIPKIINGAKSTATTSNYTDKLLIIDFWGTGCESCIEAMPKMNNLQKQFGNKIKIFPVTNEKSDYVRAFWKNNRYTKGLNLPSVVEDKIFSSYFPHRSIPHEVWIYHGKIIGITHADYVDAQNIKKILNGVTMNWPLKYDFYTFDRSKPLFNFDPKQIDIMSTPVQYAAISDYREKVKSEGGSGGFGIVRDSVKKTIRTYFLNQPILNTYLSYWSRISDIKRITPNLGYEPNQVIWEVRDPSRYRYEKNLGYHWDWMIKNSICFESMYPDTGQTDAQVYRSIISDLDRLLGLHVRWVKKMEKVLVIKKGQITSNPAKSEELFRIGLIAYNLNQEESNPYVFDESGASDAKIPLKVSNWKDLDIIRKELRTGGFLLEEELREVEHLIFTEVNGGKLIDSEMQLLAKARRIAQKDLPKPSNQENEAFLKNNRIQPGVKQTSTGLQYKIIREGNGKNALATNRVLVQYEAKMVNGKIFDSSYEKGRPAEFSIKEVIKGWTEALQLMKEGSEWELYIPAELAYGSNTAGGKILANSTLIFRVELVKILP